jgi:hypothetical protein
MKIKIAFIIFAIPVLSFICLRSGTAITTRSPLSDKQISSARAVPLGFLSWSGGIDQPSTLRAKYIGSKDGEKISGMNLSQRENWNSRTEAQIEIKGWGIGFRGSNDDPETPPPGQKVSFRVCDAYAYFYSQHQEGPKFQLFWHENKRDAGVLACRK